MQVTLTNKHTSKATHMRLDTNGHGLYSAPVRRVNAALARIGAKCSPVQSSESFTVWDTHNNFIRLFDRSGSN